MNKITKIRFPSYLTDFHCIGGACEDSCCIGWDIDLDKKTFKQYSRTKNTKVKKNFEEHIYKNRLSCNSEVDYGGIAVKDNTWCPFLESDKYCYIQRNLGEDELSNVCYSFPRVYNILNEVYELSLYLSCPEAVRNLLSSEEPISFEEKTWIERKHIVNHDINTDSRRVKNSPIKHLPEIRSNSIKIMQDRSYSLHKRIYNLGNIAEKIHSQFFGIDKQKLTKENIKNKFVFQLDFFKYAIESLGISDEIESPVFLKYSEMVIGGFSLEKNDINDSKIELYKNTIETIVEPYLVKNSYMFEHYLVNGIFQNNFPFSDRESIFDSYVLLLFRYAFILFYLSGLAAKNGSLCKKDIVEMIQIHTKVINHHKSFSYNILQEVKRKGYDNMDTILNLI